MQYVVDVGELPVFPVGPAGSQASIFNGAQHEFAGASLMLAELQPGEGPARHRHAYGELFVIVAGTARFTIDSEEVEARPGQVVLVPAGVPHAFVNAGSDVLRLTAVHVAPRVEIEWLDAPWMPG
jgi:mannose-6-phosphate isomerase-like protein (cupin superfamily)